MAFCYTLNFLHLVFRNHISNRTTGTSTLRFVDTASSRDVLDNDICPERLDSVASLFRSVGRLSSTTKNQDVEDMSSLTRLLWDDIVLSKTCHFSCWIANVRADTVDIRDDLAVMRFLEILSLQQEVEKVENEEIKSLETVVKSLSSELEDVDEKDARRVAISLTQHRLLEKQETRSIFERFWQTSVDAEYRSMLLTYAGIHEPGIIKPLMDLMIESPESLLEILNRLREEDKLDEVASSHLNKDESLTFWTFCESLAILGIHAPSEITRATFEQHVAGNTRANMFGIKSRGNKKSRSSNWCLVNLSEDMILNEILSFQIESSLEVRRVGSLDNADSRSALHLGGLGVQDHHCVFKDDGDVLNLKMSSKQADVFVNGKRILEEAQLVHGDSVVIGFSHYFVVRRLGVVDASSSVNLTQIRCDVARSRLTKHKRRQHRHLRLENDVTSAMHYVCEANAIGTYFSHVYHWNMTVIDITTTPQTHRYGSETTHIFQT